MKDPERLKELSVLAHPLEHFRALERLLRRFPPRAPAGIIIAAKMGEDIFDGRRSAQACLPTA